MDDGEAVAIQHAVNSVKSQTPGAVKQQIQLPHKLGQVSSLVRISTVRLLLSECFELWFYKKRAEPEGTCIPGVSEPRENPPVLQTV